jgi:hypothetical protein
MAPARNCFCHLAMVVWDIWSLRATADWVISPRRTESTIRIFWSALHCCLRPMFFSCQALASL